MYGVSSIIQKITLGKNKIRTKNDIFQHYSSSTFYQQENVVVL